MQSFKVVCPGCGHTLTFSSLKEFIELHDLPNLDNDIALQVPFDEYFDCSGCPTRYFVAENLQGFESVCVNCGVVTDGIPGTVHDCYPGYSDREIDPCYRWGTFEFLSAEKEYLKTLAKKQIAMEQI